MNNQFVLIASDDHVNAKNLERAILSFGCRVATISREYMTSTRVNEFQPSLLILDLEHWDSATHEQLSWQDNVCAQQSCPVLAMSAQPLPAPFFSKKLKYLQKPVDVEHVRQHLVWLKKPHVCSTVASTLSVDSKGLDEIQAFLLAKCGLDFNWDHRNSLERAIKKRMGDLGLVGYADYLKQLISRSDARNELANLIDILSVGETSFFRYEAHDKTLIESVLPEIIKRKGHDRSLRIWSAGCATGEEPFSLALMIKEYYPQLLEWDLRILATDINQNYLRQADLGQFSERSVRAVPQDLRNKHFEFKNGLYVLSKDIRDMVSFEYLNLHSEQFLSEKMVKIGFDIIMCRNVLIYFDADSRKTTSLQLINNLHPEGYMFFGHTEMMQNTLNKLQPLKYNRGFYYRLKSSFIT
ncbi:MAG: hypothetical protein KAU27_03360 [Desulfuromonadales bacterium]|nr:hypothetical protein [Desulfuromonadales bacterium]